jgi:hypothetical protein
MNGRTEAGSKIIPFYPKLKKDSFFFCFVAPVEPQQGFRRINQVQQMEQRG